MRCASESVGVLRSPKPSPTTTQQPSAWPSAYANPPSTLTQPMIHLQLQPRHDVNETTTTGLNLVAFCVVAAVLLRGATLRRDQLNPCGCSLGMWDHGNSTRRRFSPLLQNQTYTWHAYRSVRYRIVVYLLSALRRACLGIRLVLQSPTIWLCSSNMVSTPLQSNLLPATTIIECSTWLFNWRRLVFWFDIATRMPTGPPID